MDWTYTATGLDVDQMYGDTHRTVFAELGGCGTWWTGPERVALIAQSRAALACDLCRERREAVSPNAVAGTHLAPPDDVAALPVAAIEAVHRITTDPGRLTRTWADEVMADIGAGPYVELAALVATLFAIDRFAVALGHPIAELPEAQPGTPSREVPDGVGDVGAWVPQTIDKTLANVTRAASMVPAANDTWRAVSVPHYSRGAEFMQLEWERPLSRPQVELVASTVSAANECFY